MAVWSWKLFAREPLPVSHKSPLLHLLHRTLLFGSNFDLGFNLARMINKKLIVFPIHEKVVLNLVFQLRRIYGGICIPLSAARSKAVTWLSGLCLPISRITSAHQLSTDCLLIHLLSPFSYLSHSQGPLSTDVQQISRSSLFSLFTVASNHLPCTL